MGRTIVVGLDGSEMASRALRWAVAMGRRSGATVQPVLVWEYPAVAMMPFPAGLPVPPEDAMQAEHEQVARMAVEQVHDPDGAEVLDPIVVRGGSGRALCNAAVGAGLLVVGSRGLGAMRSLVMGSVGSYCANHAPCPVAVIPSTWVPPAVAQQALRVVVGVDGSPHSDAAIVWADEWASADATLTLVHAWDVPVTVDGAALMYHVDDLAEAAQRVGERALDMVSPARRGADLVELKVMQADARSMLEEVAEAADLVVIGSRGHRGIERMLLGSVASYTMHHVRVPTVVVGGEPRE